MGQGEARELYRELLAVLSDRLRPHGFRRQGGNFQREFDGVAQVIGVQKSDASTRDRMKFTLNVGIWSQDLDLVRGIEGRPPRSVLHCHASDRIGNYSPLGRDVWWNVYDEGDLCGACARMEPLLMHGVLPHLDRLTTSEAILSEWIRGWPGLVPTFDRERFVDLLRGALDRREGHGP